MPTTASTSSSSTWRGPRATGTPSRVTRPRPSACSVEPARRQRRRRGELDLHQPGHRPDRAQRQRVGPVPRRAEVDDGGDVAARVVHRRRVADPVADRLAPVLGGEDRHRTVGDQGERDAVGPGNRFVPAAAGDQADVVGAGRLQRPRGAAPQHPAVGVGDDREHARRRCRCRRAGSGCAARARRIGESCHASATALSSTGTFGRSTVQHAPAALPGRADVRGDHAGR